MPTHSRASSIQLQDLPFLPLFFLLHLIKKALGNESDYDKHHQRNNHPKNKCWYLQTKNIYCIFHDAPSLYDLGLF